MRVDAHAATNISNGKIWLSQKSFVYDGTAKRPEVTLVVNGETISSWNYNVTYSKNVNAGTAKVTLKADDYWGEYTGKISRTFKIKKRKLYKSRFSLNSPEYVYNGKVKKVYGYYNYPDYRTKLMKRGRDIKVWSARKLKKVGKYRITIHGKGNFKGKIKYTITIRPKNPKGVRLVKRYKNSFRVKWKKVKGATSYRVEYWNEKKEKTISRNRGKRRWFNVPVHKDYQGWVTVYAVKKVRGKKIRSRGVSYYNGVRPRVKPKFSFRNDGRTFYVKMKRNGHYEMWTATNKKFTRDFKPFTFYCFKGDEYKIYGASSGEYYRFIKIRQYITTNNDRKIFGPWSKIKRVYWY
jgi:hypothetical protein